MYLDICIYIYMSKTEEFRQKNEFTKISNFNEIHYKKKSHSFRNMQQNHLKFSELSYYNSHFFRSILISQEIRKFVPLVFIVDNFQPKI